MAAPRLPPAPSTETTAICAEPANVVADIAIAATEPMPADRASTPNVTPNAKTAIEIGAIKTTPSR